MDVLFFTIFFYFLSFFATFFHYHIPLDFEDMMIFLIITKGIVSVFEKGGEIMNWYVELALWVMKWF